MARIITTAVPDEGESPHEVTGPTLEAAVDADIAAFDACFQNELQNAPLISSERAVLKTYLWYKCRRTEPPSSG